ncbi:MAG TPA: hypothetical protein VHU91_06580 [Mycobacteriales bacterium]|jgi:hypothetical protein|nr:hypothetical protein [Mycobacteriales bacterium]
MCDPNTPNYMPLPPPESGVPLYQTEKFSGEILLQINFRILPTAADALRLAEQSRSSAKACAGHVEGGLGDSSDISDISNFDYHRDGWTGAEVVTVGKEARSSTKRSDYAPLTDVAISASRGVVFAELYWQRSSEKDKGKKPSPSWKKEGERALRNLLIKIGGDPKQQPPQTPNAAKPN